MIKQDYVLIGRRFECKLSTLLFIYIYDIQNFISDGIYLLLTF